MSAGTYNFPTHKRGTTFSYPMTRKTSAGVAIDITGRIYRLKVKRDINDTIPVIYLSNNAALFAVIVSAGGLSYVVGDILTVAGGTDGTVSVASVGLLGAVTGITIVTEGKNYTTGVKATTGGTGTGCTINVTAIVHGITLTTPLSGILTLAMTAAETAALDFDVAGYDMEEELADGTVTPLLEGTFPLSREFTD